MEIRFENKKALLLCGVSFFGNPFTNAAAWDSENEIGSLWHRFFKLKKSCNVSNNTSNDYKSFEMHVEHPNTKKNGLYEVFIGEEISDPNKAVIASCMKYVPNADYAIVTVHGLEVQEDILKTLEIELHKTSNYTINKAFSLLVYDKRFKGMDKLSESILDYWIPLKTE